MRILTGMSRPLFAKSVSHIRFFEFVLAATFGLVGVCVVGPAHAEADVEVAPTDGYGTFEPAPPDAPEPAPAPPTTSPADQALATILAGIHVVGPNERTMERSALDLLLSHSSLMYRAARFIPVRENNVPVGVRTFGIRRRSLLAALGLRNGDTIKALNGRPITSPQEALAAYASLRGTRRLVVSLSRRGLDQTLVVRIVGAPSASASGASATGAATSASAPPESAP